MAERLVVISIEEVVKNVEDWIKSMSIGAPIKLTELRSQLIERFGIQCKYSELVIALSILASREKVTVMITNEEQHAAHVSFKINDII